MSAVLFVCLWFSSPSPQLYSQGVRVINLVKGACLGSLIQTGMTPREVRSLVGEPDMVTRPWRYSCVFVCEGDWIYQRYGLRVHFVSGSEMWWDLPADLHSGT